MLLSVSISLSEQPLVVVLLNCATFHEKLDLGHLNMDNLLLTVPFCQVFQQAPEREEFRTNKYSIMLAAQYVSSKNLYTSIMG